MKKQLIIMNKDLLKLKKKFKDGLKKLDSLNLNLLISVPLVVSVVII